MQEYQSTITKDEINLLPLVKFEGNIHLIDSFQKLDACLPLFKDVDLLGFDTETKPSFRKGNIHHVALLQLVSEEDAFIFRLNKISLPREITAILSNKKIIKVGVAIHDDIKKLQKLNHHIPQNFIDLQNFVKTFNIEVSGLQKLIAIVLKKRISKSQQLSNWENDFLTEAQLLYAATDAWACRVIYKELILNKLEIA